MAVTARVRKGGPTIDILGLIDRLEALVNSGTRVPLTSKALVDEQEFLELVDQLRVAVPDEVRHAKRVSQDRDRVILQARSEADRTLAQAQEQAALLLQESEIVRRAQQQANEMLGAARAESMRLRSDADNYALEVLDGLDKELNRLLAIVRKGKAALAEKSSRAAEPRVPEDFSVVRPGDGKGLNEI